MDAKHEYIHKRIINWQLVLGRSNNFVWEYNNKKGLNKIIDFYFD